MEFKLDKDQLRKGGKIALRVGKAVVVEGVKALALKTAATTITGAFEGKKVTEITLDDVIGKEKEKGDSKKWFSRKKKENEIEETIEELTENIIDEKKQLIEEVKSV